MTEVFEKIVTSLSITQLELFNVVFALLLATAISLIISQVYKHTHRGLNFELAFMTTLVALAPIVAIVMMFIRGDLVLSLGLIGSLSIIRFRTPIKDTRDMIFLFWVIATGLGCGTHNWSIVIISAIVVSIILFVLHFVSYGEIKDKDFVLVVSGDKPIDGVHLNKTLKNYVKSMQIRSKEIDDNLWETIFEIQFSKLQGETIDKMIAEVKLVDGVQKVSLLAPQIAMPV